jgi:hypothetical protein
MQFVEIDGAGHVRTAGPAPYLDYRPLADEERALVASHLEQPWLTGDLEARIVSHAIAELVPGHLEEVCSRKEELLARTLAAVKERLTKEITSWDHRAEVLRAQEAAGKENARINSAKARQRANELEARLQKRTAELEQERRLSPQPPVVIGGALVVPAGLLARLRGDEEVARWARETARVERLAMDAVMEAERRLDHEPRDVALEKVGYDIESRIPATGQLRFIEVKGRVAGSETVTVTYNEIRSALNKPDDFILAVVEVSADVVGTPRYIRRPFGREPDFGVASVNYRLSEILERAGDPA